MNILERVQEMMASTGKSYNEIVNEALEAYMKNGNVSQEANNLDTNLDTEPVKPLNNEEKDGQETGQFSLDMSKLKLDTGDSNDNFI
jgi:hypothetical protein